MLNDRMRQCARLRAAGYTWKQCGSALGVTGSALHQQSGSDEWQRYLAQCEQRLEWQLVTQALSPLVMERRRRVAPRHHD